MGEQNEGATAVAERPSEGTGQNDPDVQRQAIAMAEAMIPQLADRLRPKLEAIADARLQSQIKELGLLEVGKLTHLPADPGTNAGPFKSLGEQLQAIAQGSAPGATVDPRLGEIMAATGASEGVPADGGFLLQETFVADIFRRINETGMVFNRITRKFQLTGNSNSIKMPAIDETSRATGSRWGGIQGYRIEEGGTFTASRPKFARIALELTKLGALAYATNEQLVDTPVIETVLREGISEEFAFMLDDDGINGSGTGAPLGILNAAATVSAPKETGQQASTILYENITAMWARMWARSRANSVWFINQAIEPQLSSMSLVVGTGGIPVYLPANGISGAPFATLFGRPVIPIEQAAALGTVGDIILADMTQYWEIEKGGVNFASSIHVQFITDETAFRATFRNDFRPMWLSALTPYKGADTLSPFVTLATRA